MFVFELYYPQVCFESWVLYTWYPWRPVLYRFSSVYHFDHLKILVNIILENNFIQATIAMTDSDDWVKL